MISLRQKRKLKWSKKKLMTRGGRGQYKIDQGEFEKLARVFVGIKNIKQSKAVLRDLFTDRELADIIRRLYIAGLLLENQTYDKINFITKASRPTIANIHDNLKSGGKGFEIAIERLRFKP